VRLLVVGLVVFGGAFLVIHVAWRRSLVDLNGLGLITDDAQLARVLEAIEDGRSCWGGGAASNVFSTRKISRPSP